MPFAVRKVPDDLQCSTYVVYEAWLFMDSIESNHRPLDSIAKISQIFLFKKGILCLLIQIDVCFQSIIHKSVLVQEMAWYQNKLQATNLTNDAGA